MNIELHEGDKLLYLCIVEDNGRCHAIRLFGLEDGKAKDVYSSPVTAVTAESIAKELAADINAWRQWQPDGVQVPGLFYEREVLKTAHLVARFNGTSKKWHIAADLDSMSYDAEHFTEVYSIERHRAEEHMFSPSDDGCDECRVSGLLEED